MRTLSEAGCRPGVFKQTVATGAVLRWVSYAYLAGSAGAISPPDWATCAPIEVGCSLHAEFLLCAVDVVGRWPLTRGYKASPWTPCSPQLLDTLSPLAPVLIIPCCLPFSFWPELPALKELTLDAQRATILLDDVGITPGRQLSGWAAAEPLIRICVTSADGEWIFQVRLTTERLAPEDTRNTFPDTRNIARVATDYLAASHLRAPAELRERS